MASGVLKEFSTSSFLHPFTALNQLSAKLMSLSQKLLPPIRNGNL
jgi:hypothetical protein